MSWRIPLARPDLGDSELAAVRETLTSGVLSRGPRLAAFEAALAERLGRRHAIGLSSGTAALHLSLLALKLGPGDEVLVTPFTVPASINAILAAGAQPRLVDIDPRLRCPDAGALERAITGATRAIMVVHPFGQPAPMGEIMELASRRGLLILEDACEALGSELDDGPLGSFGEVSAFGFYPNKVMTTGEGGVALTDDRRLAERLRLLGNHGRTMDGRWLDQVAIGFNYRLSELHAALGLAQLQRLDELLEARRLRVERYFERLDDSDLRLPRLSADCRRVGWFSLVVELPSRCDRRDRDRLVSAAADRGIQLGRYFAPLHRQPALREHLNLDPTAYPNTDQVADRCLALPLHAALPLAAVDEVAEFLRAWVAEHQP